MQARNTKHGITLDLTKREAKEIALVLREATAHLNFNSWTIETADKASAVLNALAEITEQEK